MVRENINEELIKVFCKEFQAIWLIDIRDMTFEVFSSEEQRDIAGSEKFVSSMKFYDQALQWYIDECVLDYSKMRVSEETNIENVLERTKDGKPFFVEYGRVFNDSKNYNQLCFDRINDENGELQYVVLGFRDIDVRKKAEIDDLTGLLTRHAFLKKAEEMMAEYPDEQFDVIISDIVDFKKFNETYGSKTADDILRWEGRFLLDMRTDDMLIGRYGGDQMVIFGAHGSMLMVSSDDSRDRFYESEKHNGLPDIVIKFGAYFDIRHDQSVLASCDMAHMALNSIKRHYVKDMALYDDKMKNRLDKQRRIEESMHDSLKNGDFKVYYQPKHEAKTGKLIGAEALIRWIHPEYGFMSPADFIPLFEQNGFIVENDMYVLRKTCENLRRWNNKGIAIVPISINMSKMSMSNLSVDDDLKWHVVKNGLTPSMLHIEITETLMLDDVDEFIVKLNQIREAGFEIELDDFGAGYSSINILSTLPIDVVKLDMSFMRQFGDTKRSKVLAACVNLAKELGFKTVSEGVEHKEQSDILGDLGVDAIQGYYYSKPLPEEEFERYLIKNS